LTKAQFKHDFLQGLGSAILELQTCGDPARYGDIVLYGCLRNTTYDMQCEGDRGRYLHQAAKLAGGAEAVETAVIQRFSGRFYYGHLFEQLASILYHFAEDGGENAREALYRKYDCLLGELSRKRKFEGYCHSRDWFFWLCVRLTSLGGWSAFKRIVGDVSERLLPKDAEFFFDDWFYCDAKDKFGQKRVEAYLEKQSERSPFIREYYDTAKEREARLYSDDRPVPTLAEVLADEGGNRGLVIYFARKASAEDLTKLVRAALSESDTKKKLTLLWPFRSRLFAGLTFPEDALFQLLESDDERLRHTAYEIMGQKPTAKTRELALSLIHGGEDVENGVSLLLKNIRPEDETLLYDFVKSYLVDSKQWDWEKKYWDWHGVFMDAVAGLGVMRGRPKTDILEYLYRNTLCGSCRWSIVRLMHRKKLLPEAVLQECRFDSNDDIRDFAGRVLRRSNRRSAIY